MSDRNNTEQKIDLKYVLYLICILRVKTVPVVSVGKFISI